MSSPLHPAIDPLDIYPPGIFLLFFWPSHGACRISVSQAGIKPTSPAVEAQNLKYWTTQEAPSPRTLSCVHTKTLQCVQSSSPTQTENNHGGCYWVNGQVFTRGTPLSREKRPDCWHMTARVNVKGAAGNERSRFQFPLHSTGKQELPTSSLGRR